MLGIIVVFNKITNQAQEVSGKLQEQAGEMSEMAQEQFNAVLEEYQKVLPIAEDLGLSVGSFKLEMGVIPEIRTTLVGSLDRINEETVKEITAANKANKLLGVIFNALLLAKNLQERLKLSVLKGVTVDVKLGVTPNVSVNLMR
ncbi:MAG: hypothetical protein F6K45_14110 [Kamptonema sp. SIO1D9]|nr:hypothetical protein [Kamptonema sp. SIO1D9]